MELNVNKNNQWALKTLFNYIWSKNKLLWL